VTIKEGKGMKLSLKVTDSGNSGKCHHEDFGTNIDAT
jgi:hypothetical protein